MSPFTTLSTALFTGLFKGLSVARSGKPGIAHCTTLCIVFGAALAIIAPTVQAQIETGESTATSQDPESASDKSNRLRKQAYAAVQKGQHAAAADAFVALHKLEPRNADWILEAADNMGKSGRFNDAMDLLESQKKAFSDVPNIILMLARIYHLKADTMVAEGSRDQNVTFYYEDVVRTAKSVLQKDAHHLEARLLVASAEFQLGRFDTAIKSAEIALQDQPHSYGAFALIGKVRFAQFVAAKQELTNSKPVGKAKEAAEAEVHKLQVATQDALGKAAKADPNRAFPQQKLGDLAAWTGRTKAALASYRAALSISPRCSIDHSWLRTSYKPADLAAMYEGAVADYAGRPKPKADKAGVLVWYAARAYYDLQKWKKSIALFKLSLQGLPDYHDTLYYLMQASYWDGDSSAAGTYAVQFAKVSPRGFADMIRKDDQIQAILRGIAAGMFKQDNLVGSREINHVLAFAKQTADEWNNYAFLCRDTGKFKESLVAYERALDIEVSPQLLNDAAVILQYNLKSPETDVKARAYYEQAIKLAKKMLADPNLDADVRARTKTALQDAKGNLRKFKGRGK